MTLMATARTATARKATAPTATALTATALTTMDTMRDSIVACSVAMPSTHSATPIPISTPTSRRTLTLALATVAEVSLVGSSRKSLAAASWEAVYSDTKQA